MTLRLRDLWSGWHKPSFDGDGSPLEPWAVWLLEFTHGPARQWRVHGRLLKAPWTRVGGGRAHRPGPPNAEARAWLQQRGLVGAAPVWFPAGSLLRPDTVQAVDLREYRPEPTKWAPKIWHDSLASAREAGQRMADTICPRHQTRRSFPPR